MQVNAVWPLLIACAGFQWWGSEDGACADPLVPAATPLREGRAPACASMPLPAQRSDTQGRGGDSAEEQDRFVASVVSAAEDFLASPTIRGPRSRLAAAGGGAEACEETPGKAAPAAGCALATQRPTFASLLLSSSLPSESRRNNRDILVIPGPIRVPVSHIPTVSPLLSRLSRRRRPKPSPLSPDLHLQQIAPTPLAPSDRGGGDASSAGPSPGTPSPPAELKRRPAEAEVGSAGSSGGGGAAFDARAAAVLSRWFEGAR